MSDEPTYQNGRQDASIQSIQKTVDRIEGKLSAKIGEKSCSRRHIVLWLVMGGLASFDVVLLGLIIAALRGG